MALSTLAVAPVGLAVMEPARDVLLWLPLSRGSSLDNGWDFNLISHQRQLLQRLDEEEPDEVLLAPECRLWSRMQTPACRTPAQQEALKARREHHHRRIFALPSASTGTIARGSRNSTSDHRDARRYEPTSPAHSSFAPTSPRAPPSPMTEANMLLPMAPAPIAAPGPPATSRSQAPTDFSTRTHSKPARKRFFQEHRCCLVLFLILQAGSNGLQPNSKRKKRKKLRNTPIRQFKNMCGHECSQGVERRCKTMEHPAVAKPLSRARGNNRNLHYFSPGGMTKTVPVLGPETDPTGGPSRPDASKSS